MSFVRVLYVHSTVFGCSSPLGVFADDIDPARLLPTLRENSTREVTHDDAEALLKYGYVSMGRERFALDTMQVAH